MAAGVGEGQGVARWQERRGRQWVGMWREGRRGEGGSGRCMVPGRTRLCERLVAAALPSVHLDAGLVQDRDLIEDGDRDLVGGEWRTRCHRLKAAVGRRWGGGGAEVGVWVGCG
mgnify:CR=1 FL=1